MEIKNNKDLKQAIDLVVELLPLDLENRKIKLESMEILERSMKIIIDVRESDFLPEILLKENLDENLEKRKSEKIETLKYENLLDNAMNLALIDLEVFGFPVYIDLVE